MQILNNISGGNYNYRLLQITNNDFSDKDVLPEKK